MSLYAGRLSFKAQICVYSLCVFALKMKVAQKIGDGDEMTARPFHGSSIRRGKEERWRRPGQQKLLAGELLLYLVREGLQHCCVWPMCVSEDKTCGSPQWKTAGHIWGSWKRAVRKVISKVSQQRPGGRDRAEEWQTARGKMDQPSREKQDHGILHLQKKRKKNLVQITSTGL